MSLVEYVGLNSMFILSRSLMDTDNLNIVCSFKFAGHRTGDNM